MTADTDRARTRLTTFAEAGEIAWPAGEGIDTAGDRARGWDGPYLAGTWLYVSDAGRNLAEHWDECREWYGEKTDAQCAAMRDYYLAHRDLFQARAWREAQYDQEYRPGGNREALQSDVRALLAALATAETERDRDAARLAELARFESETFAGVTQQERNEACGRYAMLMFRRLERLARQEGATDGH